MQLIRTNFSDALIVTNNHCIQLPNVIVLVVIIVVIMNVSIKIRLDQQFSNGMLIQLQNDWFISKLMISS